MTSTSISRETIKPILAMLLSDQGPRTRFETLAHHSGFRTDAAMTAAGFAFDVPKAQRSQWAAQGRVLPHLVACAQSLMTPQDPGSKGRPKAPPVDVILKTALADLDFVVFKENLEDVFAAARTAPPGPARWLFAVAAADVLLKPKPGSDKFWSSKAVVVLCGVLALAGHIAPGAIIDEDLVAQLKAVSSETLSPWERLGQDLLPDSIPGKTQESILATLIASLPRASRPDVVAGPEPLVAGIGPTQSWGKSF